MLDVAAINAWALYQHSSDKTMKSRQAFQEALADALLSTDAAASSRLAKRVRSALSEPSAAPDPQFNADACVPNDLDERKDCAWCSTSEKRLKVKTGCVGHGVNLHYGKCWQQWHRWVRKGSKERKQRFKRPHSV